MATDTVRELSAFSDDGLEIYVRVEERGRRIVIDPLACWLARDLGWIGGDATVVFYDPRGRGRSSVPGGDSFIGIEADVADLECVRRTLRIDRCDLLGWSYYAAVIAHYARAHPGVVERLLLVAPVPLRRDPHMLRAALHLAERIDPQAVERLEGLRLDGMDVNHPAAYARAFHRVRVAPGHMAMPEALMNMRSDPFQWPNEWPANLAHMVERRTACLGAWNWRNRLKGLHVPTLILQGDEDATSAEAAREWLTVSTEAWLVILAQSGHYPWLERPDVFRLIADHFLVDRR